jgi:signal transduction histidine kinase
VRDALTLAFGKQSEELQRLGQRLEAETTDIETALQADRELIGKLFDALQARESAEGAEPARRAGTAQPGGASALGRAGARGHQSRRRLVRRRAGARAPGGAAALVSASFTVLVGLWVAWNARAPAGAARRRHRARARGDARRPDAASAGRFNDEIGELAATFESMVAANRPGQRRAASSERLAAIGKMAAQVTHEVRNPLSSLRSTWSCWRGAGRAPGRGRRALEAVKLEVERLTQLTEKYLSLARRSRPDFREDLGSVVSEAVASAEPSSRSRRSRASSRSRKGCRRPRSTRRRSAR